MTFSLFPSVPRRPYASAFTLTLCAAAFVGGVAANSPAQAQDADGLRPILPPLNAAPAAPVVIAQVPVVPVTVQAQPAQPQPQPQPQPQAQPQSAVTLVPIQVLPLMPVTRQQAPQVQVQPVQQPQPVQQQQPRPVQQPQPIQPPRPVQQIQPVQAPPARITMNVPRNQPPQTSPNVTNAVDNVNRVGHANASNVGYEDNPPPHARTAPASRASAVTSDKAAFIDDMAARYNFDPAQLRALLARANYSAAAIRLVTPSSQGSASGRNWRAQEARFVDATRINAGVAFWRKNRAALQRAYRETGVPPEIIVGIIGAETIYGRDMGNFRVLDVLSTLAFNYPDTPNRAERMAMFRKNLQDYLLWTRYEHINPTTVLGSYTGAIGIPQFLPSNILQYAVDYNGSHHIDLRTNAADAIGSVANYLKSVGWAPGQPVVLRIASDPTSQNVAAANATGQAELHLTLGQLTRAGLTLAEPNINVAAAANAPVTVVDLPTPGRPTEYLLGLQNFYALTRYNRSFFYALSVYELGQRVKARVLATTPSEAIN